LGLCYPGYTPSAVTAGVTWETSSEYYHLVVHLETRGTFSTFSFALVASWVIASSVVVLSVGEYFFVQLL
jgi:hypothetical protein